MLLLDTPADFLSHVGHELGASDWLVIEQPRIDEFARSTGDDFWIHVDRERAARDMPGGSTIAHGLLLLALVPLLQRQIFRVKQRGKGLNYGSNRVRYPSSVAVDSRVRLRQKLLSAERMDDATRIVTECTIEVEGAERPGVVGEFILHLQDR